MVADPALVGGWTGLLTGRPIVCDCSTPTKNGRPADSCRLFPLSSGICRRLGWGNPAINLAAMDQEFGHLLLPWLLVDLSFKLGFSRTG